MAKGLSTDETLSAAEVVEIVRIYVDLKERSGAFRAYCPLCHKDEYSFAVDAEQGQWRCSRCGEGGDVYELFMRIRHCSREDAVRFVTRANETNRRRAAAPSTLGTRKPGPAKPAPGAAPTAAPEATPAGPESIGQAGKSGATVEPADLGAEPVSPPGAGAASPPDVPPAAAPVPPVEPPAGPSAAAPAASPAQTPAPAAAEPAAEPDFPHLAYRIAECMLAAEGCRGLAFVRDLGRDDREVLVFSLAALDKRDALEIDAMMRQTLAQLPRILGEMAQGNAKTVFTIRATKAGEPVQLLWSPIVKGQLRFNVLLSVDPTIAESMTMLRLRYCMNKAGE
jgi:hypothetical protein